MGKSLMACQRIGADQVRLAAAATQRNVREPYFAIYDDAFLKILGPHPAIALAVEKDWPFAHEAGVYIPCQDAVFITSNAFRPTESLERTIKVSKVSRQEDGSWLSEVIETNVAMGNGGINFGTHVLFCDQGTKTTPGGLVMMNPVPPYSTETVIDSFHGRLFNSVNDVVVKRDKSIWFTDPIYGFEQGFRSKPQLPCQVYRHDRSSKDIRAMADGFGRPNGLAFSPDEKVLYVTDTDTIHGDGTVEPMRASTM